MFRKSAGGWVIGCLAVALATPALPATTGTSARVMASVEPAHCTPAQQRVSRSCAAYEVSVGARPAAFAVPVAANAGEVSPGAPRYMVHVDTSREVLVRTLQY